MTSLAETCQSCEVSSVEEGHDVDGCCAPQSMSADFDGVEGEGVGSEDQSP